MTTWTINGKTPDQSFIFRSGLRMQITPEGDCREATFMAKGAGLGLRPLDTVQIAYNGVPIFYGEVRVGGNPHDVDGHQYTLRSLALRLREVVIPAGWSAPQQPAHLTVRSLLEAVLDQLGGAISIGTISDLGFNCRAIKNANQQNPYALLEQIASDGAGLGVKVRFGVNPNRQFFWVKAREDVAALTNNMLTGATRFTAPVAEAPCTAVLWFVAKRPDGSWVTHLSEAPEVAVYGRRVKALSVDASVNLWRPVTGRYAFYKKDGAENWVFVKELSSDDAAKLADPDNTATLYFVHPNIESSGLLLEFVPDGRVDRMTAISSTVSSPNGAGFLPIVQIGLKLSGFGFPGCLIWADTIVPGGSGTVYRRAASEGPLRPFTSAVASQGLSALFVTQLRGEQYDRDLLDRLARFHYNIPASAPADIELREFRPPSECAGYVTLNGWQSPVEAWEYRLSADRGMTVGVLAGQADDPNKLAQAELIKARDGRAVTTALTSRS